jgi:hypothetical protein
MTPLLLLGAFALSLAIGILAGLFGVGGGFLLTPLLNIVLGLPMPLVAGTGSLQILSVSTSGLYARRHEKRTDFKMALMLFGGNMAGAQLGVATLRWLSSLGTLTMRGQQVTVVDFAVLWVFLILLVLIALWMWWDTSRTTCEEPTSGLFARLPLPPLTRFDSLDGGRLSIIVMSYFGLALGFMAGLLGVGGGVIMVPGLIYLVGMRTHRATATSMAMVWLTSFAAIISHALAGNINLTLAIPLLVGGSLGVQVGVALSGKLGGRHIRRYFTFVVLAAVLLVAGRLGAILF